MAEHRAQILGVARVLFCQRGFDQTGVREVAAAAGVDPAIIVRVFGSKEGLFEAVAEGAFSLEPPFEGPVDGMGLRIARMLTGKSEANVDGDFDELQLLLRSAASAVAGPILARSLHAGFVAPLAKRLGGRDAGARASLLTACILGFVTMRVALGAQTLEGPAVVRRLGSALQACVEP